MDLNGDGNLDLLSGSYSRKSADMAGLFQVLYGTDDGGFRKAEVLNGSDGKPLIITGEEKDVVSKICTRPSAADLDGDGHLDLIVGNFRGTFHMFRGNGDGTFESTSTKLLADGKDLAVPSHSDPFVIDWDADGDLDLLSGSAKGGVFLSLNSGLPTEPAFGAFTELIKPVKIPGQMRQMDDFEYFEEDIRMGDSFLVEPQKSTRVFAADVNGDGQLDLLVGDSITLYYPAEGVDDDDALAAFEAWNEKQSELYQSYPEIDDEAAIAAFEEKSEALQKERDTIVTVESTGFVWVYIRK